MITAAFALGTGVMAQQTSGIHLLMESLRTGGVVMFMIVACSMVAVTVAIMTWLRLREHALMPRKIIGQLRSLPAFALKGDISPLHDVLVRDRSILARLSLLAVSGQFTTKAECAEVVEQKAKEELHKLERDMPWLEVMVSVAPLLGLLGTTIGLVGMFTALGDTGSGPDMGAVAREIGVALRCTIAGLFVAVPSVVAHTYFVRKLDMIGMKLESILQDTIQNFYQHFEVQKSVVTDNGDTAKLT
jgi:biopolymer transport protein ExbB